MEKSEIRVSVQQIEINPSSKEDMEEGEFKYEPEINNYVFVPKPAPVKPKLTIF